MAYHRCAIHQEDGTLVAAQITVSLEAARGEGAAEWYGTLTVTREVTLEAGQRYRLVLDDGRAGQVLVRRNTMAGGADRSVAFRGLGPLQ